MCHICAKTRRNLKPEVCVGLSVKAQRPKGSQLLPSSRRGCSLLFVVPKERKLYFFLMKPDAVKYWYGWKRCNELSFLWHQCCDAAYYHFDKFMGPKQREVTSECKPLTCLSGPKACAG